MFYREAGQYKTSYRADQALFPIRQDQIGIVLILVAAYRAGAADGVRLRDRFSSHAGADLFARRDRAQSAHRLHRAAVARHRRLHGGRRVRLLQACDLFPRRQHSSFWIICSGFFAAAAGIVFGLPSLRIKGFYLAVATLASQFFLSWCFIRIPWLYNYNISASIEVPTRTLFGVADHRAERDTGSPAISSC